MELYNGDCLEVMKDIKDGSIDLLFCDLPYGQTSCKWDCLIDLDLFWEQINRICKEDCPMFFTCSTKFGVNLINSNPKNFRYDLVWLKSSPCGFLNAKKMPMKKHEMVYVFYKKIPKVYGECIAEHHTHKFIKESKSVIRNDGGCKSMYGNEKGKIFIYDEKGKLRNSEPRYEPPLPNSILEVKSEKGKHATQKPVDLIKWCLKYYSKEGDVVLDPTMGSGSTGVACKEMNRQFIGIEMNEDIFKVAEERCK
tara:strand:- start:1506 stop:2261 length:756 start_codon:yes stop_codon:yes gene_type:complete